MSVYEFGCLNCGARFAPTAEITTQHANTVKIVPVNVKKIRRHKPVVGKLVDYEEEFYRGYKILRKRSLDVRNTIEHDWKFDGVNFTPMKVGDTYRNIIEIRRLKTIMENIRDHQIKRTGDKIEIYANKDDYEIRTLPNGRKMLILKDLDHVDADGTFCYRYTIIADDFVIKPHEAVVEKSTDVDGSIRIAIKCPECGSVVMSMIRRPNQMPKRAGGVTQ